MKLLTIVVPSYNSENYLSNAIESIVTLNDERIEVLIVDDGSKDQTYAVACKQAEQYPKIVKAIHQENKGHGGAVNTGLTNATGKYFKVLDSDDWFSTQSLEEVMVELSAIENTGNTVDVFFTNYVYEQEGRPIKKVVNYRGIFPEKQSFTWDETKPFPTGKYIMMHSVIYSTAKLKEIKLTLPEHTFYVDNLFVYEPLIHMSQMYYLDTNLYRYFIGRDDQSINETVMIRRIDQQLKVNYLLIDAYDFEQGLNPNQERYLIKHLEIVTNISSALLNRMNTPEAIKMRDALWQYLEDNNPMAFKKIRSGLFGKLTTRQTKTGIWISNQIYRVMRKVGGY